MDRFQPLDSREEREIERLQQEEEEMKDEFGTIIMDDEDAIKAANEASRASRETLLQNYKSIVDCQEILLKQKDRTIADLRKQLNGRTYAS